MDRRSFLRAIPLTAAMPYALNGASLGRLLTGGDADADICASKFSMAVSLGLRDKPIGEVMVAIGKSFLGAEYLAHTLEEAGPEHLVVNLRAFDCVSFYENCLVLARCVKLNRMTFDEYKKQLQFIRYRSGVIDGYPSRLHYTSDYFFDNVKKGVVRDVTEEIGGVPFEKTVDFMTKHVDSYVKLEEHPEFVPVIAEQERAITKRKKFYVPKDAVAGVASKLQDGDIIGITTNIEGMDVTHTGLALWQDKELHFMHAPITGAKVQITPGPLAEYLAKFKKDTGIMVARPLEPKA